VSLSFLKHVWICGGFLAALLAALSCGNRPQTGVSIDSAFRAFIPSGTKVLASIRLDRLESSPLYARHEKELDLTRLDAVTERIGVDPRRDVSNLLVAWNGTRSLVLARGHFTPAEVQRKLISLGSRPTRYQTYTLIGNQHNSVVFLSKNLAAAGPPELLHAALQDHDTGSGGVPEELQQRLRDVPSQDQIWIVSRGGLPFAEIPMRSDVESALSNIVSYVNRTATGIGIDTGVHLESDISCVSDQGAQRVRDALRGGIGLARLTTKDNEADLLRLYDAVNVTEEQQMVHVRADVSGDLVDKLFAYLPHFARRASEVLKEH
jgi:hypothetical protein